MQTASSGRSTWHWLGESCLNHLPVHQNSGGQASPSLTLATTQERPSSHQSLSTSSLPLALAHKLSLACSHTVYGFFSAIRHSEVEIRDDPGLLAWKELPSILQKIHADLWL